MLRKTVAKCLYHYKLNILLAFMNTKWASYQWKQVTVKFYFLLVHLLTEGISSSLPMGTGIVYVSLTGIMVYVNSS